MKEYIGRHRTSVHYFQILLFVNWICLLNLSLDLSIEFGFVNWICLRICLPNLSMDLCIEFVYGFVYWICLQNLSLDLCIEFAYGFVHRICLWICLWICALNLPMDLCIEFAYGFVHRICLWICLWICPLNLSFDCEIEMAKLFSGLLFSSAKQTGRQQQGLRDRALLRLRGRGHVLSLRKVQSETSEIANEEIVQIECKLRLL